MAGLGRDIDFAEFYSQYPGLDVPYVHYAGSASDPDVTAYDCTLNQATFNTYEVDWAPGTITVLYNGQTCLVDHPTTGSEPFDQPFFMALTQALGVGTNAFSASSTPSRPRPRSTGSWPGPLPLRGRPAGPPPRPRGRTSSPPGP